MINLFYGLCSFWVQWVLRVIVANKFEWVQDTKFCLWQWKKIKQKWSIHSLWESVTLSPTKISRRLATKRQTIIQPANRSLERDLGRTLISRQMCRNRGFVANHEIDSMRDDKLEIHFLVPQKGMSEAPNKKPQNKQAIMSAIFKFFSVPVPH